MFNDVSGLHLPATVGLRYIDENRTHGLYRCYNFIQVRRVIEMLLGTLVAKPVARSPSTDHTRPCVKVISAVLSCVGGHRAAVQLFP